MLVCEGCLVLDWILISISNICFEMSSISLFKLVWVHPPSATVKRKWQVDWHLCVGEPLMWVVFRSNQKIKSRSIQAQDPLNCPTCLTKFHLFPHLKLWISMYLFDMVDNIKGCYAWFDLDLMFGLTQILATSKACWHTGVNLLVTFTMDVEKWASQLRKKLEKINWQLDNSPDLLQLKEKHLRIR